MLIYVVVEQYFDGCNFWDTEVEYYQSKDRADFKVLEMEETYKGSSYAAFVREENIIMGD